MEIKELRCFARVADTLNFNRAAEQLNMSQPVVTKTIAQLEHRLGVRLFERTTRRVAPTAAGVVLKREVEGLLEHVDRVQREVRHAIGVQSGRLEIGVTPLAMQTVFPAVIREFREANPDVEVTIRELPTDTQVSALLAAELDAAFLLEPTDHAELDLRVLHQETMRLAVPAAHPLLDQLPHGPIPLAAFAADTFIVPPRSESPGIHDEIMRACAVSGFRPKTRECNQGQSCLCLVEAGLGVNFITSQISCGSRDAMRIVELEQPAPVMSVALMWRRGDPSPYVEAIRDLALLHADAPVATV